MSIMIQVLDNRRVMEKKKSLSERIADRMRGRGQTAARSNLALFLAIREEIRAAIVDGWSPRVIWETLSAEGVVPFSYATFTRLCRRHQLYSTGAPPAPALRPPGEAAKPRSAGKKEPAIAGFVFDPTPNKEDLF